MSTIAIAAILTGVVVAICFLFMSIDHRQKRKAMNQLLQKFSQLGTIHDLKFSSQEVLDQYIIGLDGIQRKLLILRRINENTFDSFVIYLSEVKTCSVRKQYGTIKSGALKSRPLEQYLEKISLSFELNHKTEPVEILFYRHPDNHASEIRELESKARHWEAILSKMLTPVKKRA